MIIKVAVTGGIGSGKTTALNLLKRAGYNCVSADEIYRGMLKDEDFVVRLSEYMGISPSTENGKRVLDKKRLSEIVFNDKKELKKLDDYTHPLIMNVLTEQLNELKSEIAFAEVPLLFEGGYGFLFDYVLIVKRDYERRVSGTIERDGKSREEVERIISKQCNEEFKTSDGKFFIIENNGTTGELFQALKVVVDKILEKP